MSTQPRLNKITIKKIKLDEIFEDLGSVVEYKRCAILKYCDENGIEKKQLDKLSISDELRKLGMSYCFFFFHRYYFLF